jgi:hypothetical protein
MLPMHSKLQNNLSIDHLSNNLKHRKTVLHSKWLIDLGERRKYY